MIPAIDKIRLKWESPQNLTDFSSVSILKSLTENRNYQPIASNLPVTITVFDDQTEPIENRDLRFYLVKYDSTSGEPFFVLPVYELTPRELRLLRTIRSHLPTTVDKYLKDFSLAQGLVFSIQYFNQVPPQTKFNIFTFPNDLELLLVYVAIPASLLTSYLHVSFRDIDYSDSGLTLRLDRGDKMTKLIEQLFKIIDEVLVPTKLNFLSAGTGLGTIPLPISLGGRLPPGLLQVFDIFHSLGR